VEGNDTNVNTEKIFEERKAVVIVNSTNCLISPGHAKNITLIVLNRGTGVAEGTELEIDTKNYPFSVSPSNHFYIGDLYPNEPFKIRLKIYADENAEEKIYNLPINIYTKNGYTDKQILSIKVFSPKVKISEIETIPEYGIPGKSITLKIKLENKGKEYIRSILIKILKNKYIYGRRVAYIGCLDPNDDETVRFRLWITPNASQIIPIKIRIRYIDSTGEHTFIEQANIFITTEKTEYYPLLLWFVGLLFIISCISIFVKAVAHIRR
jgi:hypothetical protein